MGEAKGLNDVDTFGVVDCGVFAVGRVILNVFSVHSANVGVTVGKAMVLFCVACHSLNVIIEGFEVFATVLLIGDKDFK